MNFNKICVVIDTQFKDHFSDIEQNPIFQLSKKLQKHNFNIHILIVTESKSEYEEFKYVYELISENQIKIVFIDVSIYSHCDPAYFRKAKALYEFFMTTTQSFDVVLFPESQGIAYLCLKCKKSIRCFNNSILGIICQAPTQWKQESISEPIGYSNLVFSDFERSCVELADFIISSSQYLVNWMIQKGWNLPEQVHILPYQYYSDEDWSDFNYDITISSHLITDIIYYGSLNSWDGLPYFLESLLQIPQDIIRNKRVLILSPDSAEENSYINSQIERVKPMVSKIQVLQINKPSNILQYIYDNRQLLIFPSLFNISPPHIYLCLKKRIPFICSSHGGQSELIDIRDHDFCLFAPRPQAIAKKITQIFTNPFFSVPFPSELLRFVNEKTIQFFETLCAEAQKKNTTTHYIDTPLVSIIIPTYNRPLILPEAVKSALNQTYTNIEIIIVDDGSSDPDVFTVTQRLQHNYSNISVLHQENQYLGAARNAGVRIAKGDYLVFLDDDDLLFPDYISICLEIVYKENVDCVLPATLILSEDRGSRCWIYAGGGYPGELMPSSIIENTYGTSCILINRQICIEHPYPEVFRLGWEDWAFILDLHLSGIRLGIYPRPLFYYRFSNSGMNRMTSLIGNFHVISRSLDKYQKYDLGLLAELFKFCDSPEIKNKTQFLESENNYLKLENNYLKLENCGFHFPLFSSIIRMLITLTHNITFRQDIKIIRSSEFFDSNWYLKQYPDIEKADLDPAIHYLNHGWRENRDPGPRFNTYQYVESNPEIKITGKNPLVHFEQHEKDKSE